jgi:ribonuclease P protein component
VNRNFRLTRSPDFKRVRRFGRSYAHPLIVLIVMSNEIKATRIGIAASSSVGKAVDRNRAKRLLREAVRPMTLLITPGMDLVLLARAPVRNASYEDVLTAVKMLVDRAGLRKGLTDSNG